MIRQKNLTGQRIGKLVVGIISSVEQKSYGKNIKYSCTCDCGVIKDIPYSKLISKSRPTQSCGCLQYQEMMKANTKHGYRNHRVYNIWNKILSRCLNVNDPTYSEYGAKGVLVCDRWNSITSSGSFENFLEDMGLPSEGQSINRVDGAKLYSKETCEWADNTTQCYDQTKRKDNKSGRTGVAWDMESGKWLAFISKDRKSIKLGRFKLFEDAVKAREEAEIKYYGKYKQEVLNGRT